VDRSHNYVKAIITLRLINDHSLCQKCTQKQIKNHIYVCRVLQIYTDSLRIRLHEVQAEVVQEKYSKCSRN
jgi:hypothetical protein